ncbi:MAG TPA: dipeptidase [Bacteroidetes bacterium]|nr:dipeptidase [Bacteroidota bacterium]HRR08608.1 dipeptidase [Rhodothermales bacterium]
MQKALTYAADHADQQVSELLEWLRIPSVSADSNHAGDVKKAAEWLAKNLRDIGMAHVEIMPTPGHPVVYAEHIRDAQLPTVLVYGHYDVQPPDPLELWDSPPFEPVIKDGLIYARGSCDDKGQAFMHVKAAEAWIKGEGQLPLNLKFIIEGEEEVGSVHLSQFLEANKQKLAADIVVISDTSLFAEDVPSITYGLRGLAYVEVELTGPNRDLHSGVYGGGVHNPLNELCRLITNLHDADHRVTLPGFYDAVRHLSDEERAGFASLPFDEAGWKAEVDVAETRTEAGYTLLEGITARPTLDLNGIWGGYQGEGAKTVLPAKAGAKISCRLVPDQQPDDVAEMLRKYFEENTPSTMKLRFTALHGGHAAMVDIHHPAMQAASKAMEGVYGRKPVFTREGGSIPIVADFKNILGLNTVLMGFGLDSDAIHSPNEKYGIDRFHKGIEASVRFMEAFANR